MIRLGRAWLGGFSGLCWAPSGVDQHQGSSAGRWLPASIWSHLPAGYSEHIQRPFYIPKQPMGKSQHRSALEASACIILVNVPKEATEK